MACVVVWRQARAEGLEARSLLVRLSGRRRNRRRPITKPALLAGLWVLLSASWLFETYEPERLRRLAVLALPACLPPEGPPEDSV